MTLTTQDTVFFVERNEGERRSAACGSLPYMTDEGMVMVDRRENWERRAATDLLVAAGA